jgi:hypothetical protein
VLEPVFPGDQEFDGYQLNNALWIGFHGTYGMFIEEREAQYEDKPTDVLKHADKEAVLCHDCATRLCYEEPWLFDLLDPEHGHSHTLEYLAQHPNHRGWDAHREG